MQALAKRIVEARFFNPLIIGLIIFNAVLIGAETSQDFYSRYHETVKILNGLILVVFIVEAVLKITAVWPHPRRYFGDAWNVFDFSIVVLSLIPATGSLAMLARLLRLLRVLRLISAIPELRLIVSTLVRSLPGMGHVILLMSIIFYIYAVLGFHLFSAHDPTHWGNLGLSMLTLFRVVTLEDWTDVMYQAMSLHPLAWIYFVSFVILGTFVVINLFIAVVLNNLDEAKQERLTELQTPPGREELLTQLHATQQMLAGLQKQLRDTEPLPGERSG